jgi:hypothetical protein
MSSSAELLELLPALLALFAWLAAAGAAGRESYICAKTSAPLTGPVGTEYPEPDPPTPVGPPETVTVFPELDPSKYPFAYVPFKAIVPSGSIEADPLHTRLWPPGTEPGSFVTV